MKQLELKHPLAVRWLHWVNFPVLTLMIWSGLLIYWANAVYRVELFGYEVFHFFPEKFYDALGIPYQLAHGMSLHFFFMWFFALNGVIYVAYTLASGEWRARSGCGFVQTRVARHAARSAPDQNRSATRKI